MKAVPLTQGYTTFVDDEDYGLACQFKWHAAVFQSGDVYAAARLTSGTVYMHRLLLGVTDPAIVVDHKDRDTLNNRRDNLRITTKKQNNENRGRNTKSKSGVRGVIQRKNGTYAVYVRHNWVAHYFGTYGTIEEAERVAIAARQKLFTHSND
jgi:hypothetical protein